MRGHYPIAVLLCTAQALALAVVLPACAEEPAAADPALPSLSPASPSLVGQTPPAAEIAPPAPPTDPVVVIIRSKLADANIRNAANADDLAALEALYEMRGGGPLWMTEMGFSAKGQQALFEIEKAADWGLDAAAFDLPSASALPASPEARALAEIELDLAILKYARFARGGRLNPSELSDVFDQAPPLRDPKAVLTEIEAADAPDAYLRSLHPKHDQFERLRQALLKARGKDEEGAKSAGDEADIKRLIINMERWRWMPEDLGSLYVWSNTPEFMLYVIKDGHTIYADKTLVGTIGHATPVFSADMKTIVFNPDWIAPRSVLVEKLLPPLRKGRYSILKSHKLLVSYQGKRVDPARVDWSRVNILSYTFTQKGGPGNNLGKVKFLYPNKHDVYMHDTLNARRKYFDEKERDIGYGCVRMEKPDRFAEVLLAEGNGLPASRVKALWDGGINRGVTLDLNIPVHTTYFTAVVDETGKVATYPDLYGLDRKLATALFGDATGFPKPPPEKKQHSPQTEVSASSRARPAAGGNDIASSLGFLDD